MITILFFFITACGTQTYDFAEDCDVRIVELNPNEAAPGDTVSATSTPVTTVWDTAVYVNSERAEIVDIERMNCEACDECKVEEGCLACDDCDACDALCRTECIEQVNFVVPQISAGPARVSMYNGHGGSNSLGFVIASPDDTGSTDLTDTGDVDSGLEVDTKALRATINPPSPHSNLGTIRKEP